MYDFSALINSARYLFIQGMALTLEITIISSSMALVIGTFLALMRVYGSAAGSTIVKLYVNIFRSIPLLLVIFWMYYLVPYIGAWAIGATVPVHVGSYASALVSFTIFESAYFCEIVRAGLESVPRGQNEAGQALGLRFWQIMLKILIPQAIGNMAPSVVSRIITVFQDTSLVYVLSMTDFLGAATNIGQRDGRLTQTYLFVAAVYFVMSFAASQLVGLLERRNLAMR